MGFHHVGVTVSSLEEAKKFYLAALAPLEYKELLSYEGLAVGLGANGKPDFWLSAGKGADGKGNKPPSQGLHLAFAAESREVVDQFHAAALYVCCYFRGLVIERSSNHRKAGGKDNGAPGPRAYTPTYYGAFILDLDGNNIEVVHM